MIALSITFVSVLSDMDQAQLGKLGEVFGEMGVTPKCDTVTDFKAWMKDYIASQDEEDSPSANSKDVIAPVHIVTQIPQLPKFSGEMKGDQVAYDIWKFEVQSLVQDQSHKPEMINQAILRSLRGDALRVVKRMGPKTSVEDLLAKLDSSFGIIDSGEDLLAQFYSANQGESEGAVAWSLRLENLLDRATEQGQLQQSTAQDMLRSKFWSGLRQDLKDASRSYFETTTNFDELRIKVRRVEQEHKPKPATHQAVKPGKMVQSSTSLEGQSTETQDLKKMVQELMKKVDNLQRDKELRTASQRQTPPSQPAHHLPNSRPSGDPRLGPQATRDTPPVGRIDPPGSTPAASRQFESGEPTCFRCGEGGHFKIGCRRHLNS